MTDAPSEREREGAWTKLRHRKVVQWGLAYAAAAWTLLQVLEYLTETYSWPPAIRQITTPALALGLLFVLVLAWYHGDKGEQKVSRSELAILMTLVAGVGGALWWYVSRLNESAWVADNAPIRHAVPNDIASVAVLPFVDLSQAHDQEYFADGLSEEIINALARTPGLFVPARTSSFQFKGQSGDIAEFAAKLGVATVLEGSVRKAGGRVRITAQLVNAEDGFHVWSQEYDRELKDIFAIQTEIANSITGALKIRLTSRQKLAGAVDPPTANLDAYEAYLLGRYEHEKWQLESINHAIEYFRKAIALDPDFADAYANLAVALWDAKTHPNGPDYSRDEGESYRANVAAPMLARARSIAPERAEVMAAASLFAQLDGDVERAVELLDAAIAQNPNNGRWLNRQAAWLTELGQFDRAFEVSSEAVKRDPLSWYALNGLALRMLFFGRRSEVDPIVQREIAVNEVQGRGILTVVASFDGNRPAAVREYLGNYDALTAQSGSVGFGWRAAISLQFARLGLRDEVFSLLPALNAHAMLGEHAEALPALRAAYREGGNWRFLLADALYGTQRFDEAAAQYRRLFTITDRHPNVASLLQAADAARRVGAVEEAGDYRDRGELILAAATQAGADPRAVARERAMLSAYDGHTEEAVESLILALDNWNAWIWPYQPTLSNPLLAPLMEREDFRRALRANQVVIAKQRAEVVEMLCGANPVSKTYKPSPATCAGKAKRT